MTKVLRFAATAAAGFVAWLLLAGSLDPAEIALELPRASWRRACSAPRRR